MSTLFSALFHSFGLVIFFLGLQGLMFVPLTVLYELWRRRLLGTIPAFTGRVTVVVPAYNEEKTIRECVESILDSDYPSLELIVVNDGSTDSTEERIKDLIDERKIHYIRKPNGGKASALNEGIKAATGEIIIYTDADTIFKKDTISKIVRWFGDPRIDCVCGNDTPLMPRTYIQKFLAITTHIGCGFVRRALSYINCLPIITGNIGAIRKEVLQEVGGFRRVWGEDLEITFRLHKKRKRIVFDPDSIVVAECPGTLADLWKQRVRWVRSYIKIALMHRDMFLNPRYRPFSLYLPINFLNMTIVPLLQIVIALLIPWAISARELYFMDTVEVLTYLGIIFFAFISVYSILLDRAYRDLVYLPYGVLILPLSYFYNFVALYSWWKELYGAEERWEKVERGVSPAHRRWEAVAIVLVVMLAGGVLLYNMYGTKLMPRRTLPFELALSTHFDAWEDWRLAIDRITDKPHAEVISVVGVGAGRPEWVYFRWKGYERYWANHQKGAKRDLLQTATARFQKKGYRVAAIIDLFAPKYIEEHPSSAAIGYDGSVSPEQVSFAELVRGEYGRLLIELIEYICKNYTVDIINLTELSYYSYSYNPEDLALYREYTGRKDWPRDKNGNVDREDPSIWQWRSDLMADYIRQVAEVAHRYGKKLYVDVPVSWKDLKREGREAGLDYRKILEHADALIVWNYFYLEDAPPTISARVASYLRANLPKDSYYLSIGLWGNEKPVGPEELREAIISSLYGGATKLWITPDYLITEEHWNRIVSTGE